jgi:DNA-3-methyladenine glycosylase II
MPDLAMLLDRYRPQGDAETSDVQRVRALTQTAADPYRRDLPLHVTASALIVHPPTARVLLRWHQRQQAWLQVGGHGDPGESDPLAIAGREAQEETGLPDLAPWPDAEIRHVAIVDVPAGKGEPAHQHADVRFFMATQTPDAARPESAHAPLRWLSLTEARDATAEDNLRETLARLERLLAPASGRRVTHAEAARILADRDPVIARLRAETGPPRFSRPAESPFAALVRAIVYQQLAGGAASAIHGRLIAALDGDVRPEGLTGLPDETLRAVGLSRNKAASLRDLAAKVLDGTVVLSPRGLSRQSDDEVIARLSAVRGIGPWTAHMFLLFQLRRLDVWPTGDLGVRRGYGLAWQVPMPTARELQPLGDPYRPYRSVAAWYCWRAAELYAGAADSALTR